VASIEHGMGRNTEWRNLILAPGMRVPTASIINYCFSLEGTSYLSAEFSRLLFEVKPFDLGGHRCPKPMREGDHPFPRRKLQVPRRVNLDYS